MTVVRFAVLEPDRIFDLTSPRWLPEISKSWAGRKPWHDALYEPLRDLIEARYVTGFNAAYGHYERLEASIRAEGIRNPVMVSAGGLRLRSRQELPPHVRDRPDLLVSEYLGGSRLWVARRLGLPVPCIVNDYANALPDAEVLPDLVAVLARFTDKPATAGWSAAGVVLNDLPYVHLVGRRTLREQSRIRREIIAGIRVEVAQWLRANDKD